MGDEVCFCVLRPAALHLLAASVSARGSAGCAPAGGRASCRCCVPLDTRRWAPPRVPQLRATSPPCHSALPSAPSRPPCSTGCLQVCCGRNCGLLLGTAGGRRGRRKLDLRLVHNLNREATQQASVFRFSRQRRRQGGGGAGCMHTAAQHACSCGGQSLCDGAQPSTSMPVRPSPTLPRVLFAGGRAGRCRPFGCAL